MTNSHNILNRTFSNSITMRNDPDFASTLVESAISQLEPGVSYGEIFHTARKIRSQDYSLGPLDILLNDITLTDILINGQ